MDCCAAAIRRGGRGAPTCLCPPTEHGRAHRHAHLTSVVAHLEASDGPQYKLGNFAESFVRGCAPNLRTIDHIAVSGDRDANVNETIITHVGVVKRMGERCDDLWPVSRCKHSALVGNIFQRQAEI
ncbi:unnamed protein product, partial [Iphiclides podalirius]